MARRGRSVDEDDFVMGVTAAPGADEVTARKAAGLSDLELPVSPNSQPLRKALRHMAKALNLALKTDFIETDLDHVYKAARVREGTVRILHRDYFGLGDGVTASVGKALQSFRLTLKGPDPVSPKGKRWIAEHGGGSLTGLLNFLGRKLNLLQEYEDKVPTYVEQVLDRLEAKRIITQWNRDEWEISTTVIGLDVVMNPVVDDAAK